MLVTILHNVFCVTNVGNLFLYQQKYRFMLLKCMMTLVTRTNEISMIFSGAKIPSIPSRTLNAPQTTWKLPDTVSTSQTFSLSAS